MRDVRIIGHRGAADHAPENTFASFDLAVETGADALETDVHASRDGVLVLIHGGPDDALHHTTNGRGRICERTSAELGELDAGSWFDDRQSELGFPDRAKRHVGQRIPLLRDFLLRYGPRVALELEIKPADPSVGIATLHLVEALAMTDRVTFTSQRIENLRALRSASMSARVAFLSRDLSHAAIARVRDTGILFYPTATGIDASVVAAIRATGQTFVRTFDVRSPETMHAVLDAGVDGMTTNSPDTLSRILERRQARHG